MKKALLYFLIYASVIFIAMYRLLGNKLLSLNDTQLDWSGDGFKNYFSFAYHYRYGKGIWFEAMQYPYGDLLSYADGQPFIVWCFKILKTLGLDCTGYELLIVQLLPILGLLLSCYYLHKILRRFDVSRVWTVITVVACLSLSPQIFRLNVHFGLAYTFAIPWLWHIILKYNANEIKPVWFMTSTAFMIFIWAYIHPYQMLSLLLFLSAFALVSFLTEKKIDVYVLAAIALPLISFLLVNHIIDPYTDRATKPYGIWEYKTEFSSLLPFWGSFPELFHFLPGLKTSYHEGYAYPGFLFFCFPLLFYFYFKNRSTIRMDVAANKSFLASLICLAFAMGLHIALTDNKILELVPPLEQFRALGRFAWIFYYVAFLYSSILLYKLLNSLNNHFVKYTILCLVTLIWLAESHSYLKRGNKQILKYSTTNILRDDKTVMDIIEGNNDWELQDFQAVLPLPVPTEGAEKIFVDGNWLVKVKTLPFVFQSGIPMIGAYMSRMSLSRIMKSLQLGSSAFVDKEILQDLANNKSLLVLVADEDSLAFKHILSKGQILGESQNLNAYALAPAILERQEYLISPDQSNTSEALFYANYDSENNEGLFSSGSKRIKKEELLCELFISPYTPRNLRMSLWYRVDKDERGIPFFKVECLNDQDEIIDIINYRDRDIKNFEVIPPWIQINHLISIPDNCSKLRWNIRAENLLIDHALISLSDMDLYIEVDGAAIIEKHYLAELKE